MRHNIFVLGLDEFNHTLLASLPRADEYAFHAALTFDEIRRDDDFRAMELLDLARTRMRGFEGRLDGLITFFDFPVTTMLPILCHEFGLPGPSLEAVLKCEHKYWSRLEQQQVASNAVPQFYAFDPFDDAFLQKTPLLFPFWIKPAKSFRSYLSYRINEASDFVAAIATVREQIDRIASSFEPLMEGVAVPPAVAAYGGRCCIAESPLSGQQCTLEGYVFQNTVTVYGVVDSVQETDRSSFSRFGYPSRLPAHIQDAMKDVARRVMAQIGYNNATFNMEFFYNQTEDRAYILEINPRFSQSHGYLFQQVDGTAHHQVMVDLAMGMRPDFPQQRGRHKRAAKFMLRYHEDGVVTQVPTAGEIEEVYRKYPDCMVDVLVAPGQRLSKLRNQDSYSYEVADIYVAADSESELLERYARITELLTFKVVSAMETFEQPASEVSEFARNDVIPE
ncbi:MAG: acetyl-CoA carboxylase biotin carboxylase subunit family protein [Spirochaetaceae bacterium]